MRTVESIVANHEEAWRRVREGKPVWDRTIDIKAILDERQDDVSPENVTSVANRIGALLRAKLPKHKLEIATLDFEVDDLVQQLEECTIASLAIDKRELNRDPEDFINEILDELYDWADRERIWLG